MPQALADGLADHWGGVAATMRCSPSAGGWRLDYLGSSDGIAHSAAENFSSYIAAAPTAWTLWDPTSIAPALRNRVQVVDNRRFAEVDVVKRVYVPLGLDRLSHITLLASAGPRFLGWLGVWREAPFSPAELRRLAGQTQSIREQLMTIDELGTPDVSWSIIEGSLEALAQPAFLVRAPSNIELTNQAGRALLRSGGRSILAAIARAMAGESTDWSVTHLSGEGMPALAIVRQRLSGQAFEQQLAQARQAWRLTPAQVGVMRLVARGLSNKEIAAALGRAEGTVELHVSAILKRAGAESRARLLAMYMGFPI